MPARSPSNGTTRWVEISVEADPASVDDLVSLLGRHCSGGAVVEIRPVDPSACVVRTTVVKGFLPTWDHDTRERLEVALLLLSRAGPTSPPRVRVLEPHDWAESWKAFFPPQHIGHHTVIVPTWHTYEPAPGDLIVRLDPGMAFGTGLHATTRMCLCALEQLIEPGLLVLDIGTGSGILAIAAALQGATQVQAIDVDPVALAVARENVALNGVADLVHVEPGTLGRALTPDVPAHQRGGYGLVLVNILAEIITSMAPDLAIALGVGARFVASGIIEEKEAGVSSALTDVGLEIDERSREDGWVALIGHKA